MAVDLVTQIILTDYDLDEATTEKLLQGVIGCVQSPIEATSLNAITVNVYIFLVLFFTFPPAEPHAHFRGIALLEHLIVLSEYF